MKILRTDGGGGSHDNERLKIVRTILEYFGWYEHIDLLHDHKGTLTVVWTKEPTDNEKDHLLKIWDVMAEDQIEHKLLTYIDL
jgi:hypothetical protein